ncbi:serine/threonine protein kinase [Longimycelium tulufanense]|uniref:Serine/threonine protein kinase n=1 Tax=Longimycelium tulufanense TaxID=907463 RepID=A0A8J3FTZ8_9PSEU|nr:hypothetical protein [Longimycelium tulufanense]GGM45891.1 serine/threonine protein kinase [Longimycelium tulufanense]
MARFHTPKLRLLLAACAAVLLAASSGAAVAEPPAPGATGADRDVLLVGNAEGGTITLLDSQNMAKLDEINAIPDLQQRLDQMNPVERIGYEVVRGQAGGDRFVDDLAVSPDGKTLYVSRGNLADTVAIDLKTRQQLWRTKIEGFHSNHMQLSPDGTRLFVSALTARKVQVLNAADGAVVGEFPTGDWPHGNDFSPDGQRLYNSSIGVIPVPDFLEPLKGQRQLTIVDAKTLEVIRTIPFEHGIRPLVMTPDEKTIYMQLSFLNGLVEVDVPSGKIVRRVDLPLSDEAKKMKREDYPLDSAHHGLAMSGDGSKLCAAGTISNYVAILSRPALTVDRIIPVGHEPYWALTSKDGARCFVSNSQDSTISVISYDKAEEIARVPVGKYPQRLREAALPEEVIGH